FGTTDTSCPHRFSQKAECAPRRTPSRLTTYNLPVDESPHLSGRSRFCAVQSRGSHTGQETDPATFPSAQLDADPASLKFEEKRENRLMLLCSIPSAGVYRRACAPSGIETRRAHLRPFPVPHWLLIFR